MEYFYRIHFNNGDKKDFTGKDLVGKKLSVFDQFSTTDEFNVYLEKACQYKNLTLGAIDHVNIVCKKNNGETFEYGLIGANPYFYDIFEHIKEEKIWEYGKYQTVREVISTESNAYQDMRDYLLAQLRSNPEEYLEKNYRNDGKFKDILRQYAASYSANTNVEEDYHQAYELETTIRHHLTIYPIFRGVATKRFYYDQYASSKNKKAEVQKPVELTKEEKYWRDKRIADYYDKLSSVTNRTKEYNEKYDEYIEPDEYGQMNGYTGGKVL